jgi:hypothetical protein
VPTRGVRFSSAFHWVFQAPGAPSGFPLTELRLAAFKPIGKRGIGVLAGSGGTALGREAPPALQFTLGGPLALGAFGLDQFRGSNYILGRLGYLRQIGQLPPFLGGKSYMLLLLEHGSTFERLGAADFHSDLTGGLYLDTLLGPAFLGGSWGGSGRSKLFFSIGQLFWEVMTTLTTFRMVQLAWGMIGLVHAARAWDPARAGSFATLAYKAVERKIVRGVRRKWKPEQAAVTLSLEMLRSEDGTGERAALSAPPAGPL